MQTIAFARSRTAVEVLTSYLRETFAPPPGHPHSIRGYRGGYLPNERHEIEAGLRDGRVRGVVATNALELGIDIGSLDAAISVGYPGTIASTWQQMGRAGRRSGTSLSALVCSSSPIDQFLAAHPEYLFDSVSGARPRQPGQPSRPAQPPPGVQLRAAGAGERALRPRRDTDAARRARGGRLPAARRRRPLLLEPRQLPGQRLQPAVRRPGERRHRRHHRRPAPCPGRGGPVRRTAPGPREGDLHPRGRPASRRPARLGRAQGLRHPHRRRLLHRCRPRHHAQGARRVRHGRGEARRHAGSAAR